MKRTIAIAGAVTLMVVGTAFVVRAQTAGGGTPPCADLVDGSGTYSPPLTTASSGRLIWTMDLAAPSCPDVQYGLTVYLDAAVEDAAPILASASAAGDTISDTLSFDLEINRSNGGSVCVVQTTVGSPTSATSAKNGAAFDADGPGSRLLDRGPDGPAGGDIEPGGGPYCIEVNQSGSGGRTAG